MINITFPDGSIRQFEAGATPLDIAKSISPRLAQDVLAVKVNGQDYDLTRPVGEDATIQFFKWEDEEGKHAFWHSSAHLLAEALQELFPGVKFGIGPAVESGFYYAEVEFDTEAAALAWTPPEALTAYLSHEVTGQPGESMAAYWARTRG